MVGCHRETPGVHLAQFGQESLPQLGIPRMVIAAGAKVHLQIEIGRRGYSATEHSQQAHLDPLQ